MRIDDMVCSAALADSLQRWKGIDSMAQSSEVQPLRRRHIAPEAGRALEILGHAIDYLADEYIHRGGSFQVNDPAMEAMRLLIERNREIYLSCPEVPTWRERIVGRFAAGVAIKR